MGELPKTLQLRALIISCPYCSNKRGKCPNTNIKKYRIRPGKKVHLDQWNPNDTSGFDGKKEAALKESDKLSKKLEQLQEMLYAEHKHKVLVILQAMDTGGKDGTISHVFEGVNPQGVRVANFKQPTPVELDHDFLWRVHKQVPGNGELVIFNRSHYESVLIERVHKLASEKVLQRRYQQINDFERSLSEDGTTIIKFYLHIDSLEQKKRLQARLDDPTKQWKFNINDLKERKMWRDYLKAYEIAIEKTSTDLVPWYIVPANYKWFRDLVVSNVIVKTLEMMDMRYPPLAQDPKSVVIS